MVGKLALTVTIALIGIILLSGCTSPPTGQVGLVADNGLYECSSGDFVSNSELCPDEVEQDIIPSPAEKQIEVKVAVFSERDNSPIAKATIYVDGENKCTTESDGTCSFFAEPNNYTFRIQGEGIFSEEIRNISENFSSPTFKVGRKITAKITVLDELTNKGVGNIDVYLNGSLRGKTETNGVLTIPAIDESSYVLEVKKEQSSNSKTIQINSDNKEFSITITTSRTLTLIITDSETHKPVQDERVYLDGVEKGRTTQQGTIELKDILPKNYRITVSGVDAGYLNIVNQTTETVYVDMPNPIFIVGATLTVWLQGLDEVGQANVKIHNNGNIVSEDTIAVVSSYQIKEDEVKLLSQDIIRFGGIASGEMLPKDSGILDTSYWDQDDIVVVVFDKSRYLPGQDALKLSLDPNLFAEIVKDAQTWCSTEKEECAKVAGTFVGTTIKAAGYGGPSS